MNISSGSAAPCRLELRKRPNPGAHTATEFVAPLYVIVSGQGHVVRSEAEALEKEILAQEVGDCCSSLQNDNDTTTTSTKEGDNTEPSHVAFCMAAQQCRHGFNVPASRLVDYLCQLACAWHVEHFRAWARSR